MIPRAHPQHHAFLLLMTAIVVVVLLSIGGLSYVRENPQRVLRLLPAAARGTKSTTGLLQYLLGFDKERTFLLLFLNNTEMRPAGGFIGNYAVLRVRNGHLREVVVEGTEHLDRRAPFQGIYKAPQPIQDYLKVDQWQFRDSNWSPDFAESARWALWLYRHENGYAADRIDAVIGITATVLEDIVALTGPVTADGITLETGRAVEILEYEVEYGFARRGIAVPNRKDILQDLTEAALHELRALAPSRGIELLNLARRLAREKHLILYSTDPAVQKNIARHGWDGAMRAAPADGFMAVDANLGALKTDHAIARSYTYMVRPAPEGGHEGTLTILYEHQKPYDWRTSRYRSYTRVYLPNGVTDVSVTGFVDSEHPQSGMPPDRGRKGSYQVLGGYVVLESGERRTVTVTYRLSPQAEKEIAKGLYTFSVQKQIGLIDPQLTLDLAFGTKGEPDGASYYQTSFPLREDFALKHSW